MSEGLVTQDNCSEERDKVDNSITRIHERIDSVEKTAVHIETSAKNIEICVNKMERVMYGNEDGDGIITKVSNLSQKVSGLLWLGGVIIVALVTSLTGVIIGTAFKK